MKCLEVPSRSIMWGTKTYTTSPSAAQRVEKSALNSWSWRSGRVCISLGGVLGHQCQMSLSWGPSEQGRGDNPSSAPPVPHCQLLGMHQGQRSWSRRKTQFLPPLPPSQRNQPLIFCHPLALGWAVITELFGLEGTFKGHPHLLQGLLALDQVAPSHLAWGFLDEEFTTHHKNFLPHIHPELKPISPCLITYWKSVPAHEEAATQIYEGILFY